MVSIPISILTIFVFEHFLSSVTSQTCELTIGQNLIATYSGKGIYHNGYLEDKWQEYSREMYITPANVDTESFYAVEVHQNDLMLPHQALRAVLSLNDTSLLNANVSVSIGEKKADHVEESEIKINYGCHTSNQGRVKMTLEILPDSCQSFRMSWIKICKPKGYFPSVNLGMTDKGDDILHEGRIQDTAVNFFNPTDQNKFTIGKDRAHFYLYISYPKEGKSINMKQPEVRHDSTFFTPHISGSLQKGGDVTNLPTQIHFVLECTSQMSTSDFEVILPFENDDVITLYLRKECDQSNETQISATIINAIYWIFIILFVLLIVSLIYFYCQRRGLSFRSMHQGVMERLGKTRPIRDDVPIKSPGQIETYSEIELDSAKIKSEKKQEVNTELQFRKFTEEEYGGL